MELNLQKNFSWAPNFGFASFSKVQFQSISGLGTFQPRFFCNFIPNMSSIKIKLLKVDCQHV
jgi:hypothetical protein